MASHLRMKVKFHPYWEDYFEEKKSDGLIPAYIGSNSLDSPRISTAVVSTSPLPRRRSRAWRWPVAVYIMCFILMINCSAMIFSGHPVDRFINMRKNLGRFLPRWPASVAVPVSVAAALRHAAAREATLLVPGQPLSEVVLHSSLANWKCTEEGMQWSERARSSRSRLLESSRLHRRSAKEAGSEARLCQSDWGVPLPNLQSIAHVGYQPENILPPTLAATQKGVTFVTQVPLSRLHLLEDQCKLWRGLPMAAVVYIPIRGGRPVGGEYSGLDAAVAHVLRMNRKVKGYCELAMDIVVEEVCSTDVPEPVNALRNRALRLVSTEAVFLSDGLHLANAGLAEAVKNRYSALLHKAKSTAGVVIPAYALTNPWYGRVKRQLAMEWADTSFRGGILKQVRAHQLQGPMGWGIEGDGGLLHKEFTKWSNQKNKLNETVMGDGASPLALMLTKRVPWFDERVRGVEWAQALHVKHAEMHANTSTWATLGGVWAMRMAPMSASIPDDTSRPSGGSGDNTDSNTSNAHARANMALFLRHKDDVMNGKYIPAVGIEDVCYV